MAVVIGLANGLVKTGFSKEKHVVDGGFAAGNDDHVGLCKHLLVGGVEHVQTWVDVEGVEIGEIAHVAQSHHGDVHLVGHQATLHLVGHHAVFLFDADVVEIGHHTEHGHATEVFNHLSALVKQVQVAPELVDDDALDAVLVFGRLQHHAAVKTGKDAATVDVAHQHYGSVGMVCHGHVHDVAVAQVDLRYAARSLQYDGVVVSGQTVEGLARLTAQIILALASEIGIGILVANGFAVEHDLRGVV